jgi:hypothetical protein
MLVLSPSFRSFLLRPRPRSRDPRSSCPKYVPIPCGCCVAFFVAAAAADGVCHPRTRWCLVPRRGDPILPICFHLTFDDDETRCTRVVRRESLLIAYLLVRDRPSMRR